MAALTVFQKGWNYAQDGPGHRLVYHLQGCTLRCPWCANPEGLSPDGVLDKGFSCTAIPLDSILAEAIEAQALFFDNGGVTFTGGEPTVQFEALAQMLRMLRANRINAALETNGLHPRLPELFPLLHTCMIDFKHPDPGKHARVTGAPNQQVIVAIRAAAASPALLRVRIPCIPGFNCSSKDQQDFLAILKSCAGKNTIIELLRYHEYGKPKWERCGMPWTMRGSADASACCIDQFSELLKKNGLQVLNN